MTLYEKIQVLCRAKGFEISNLGDKIPDLKVTRGSISGWKNGAKPRADKIKLIADYFGVDISYFYEGMPANEQLSQHNKNVVTPATKNGDDKVQEKFFNEFLELCQKYSALSEEQLFPGDDEESALKRKIIELTDKLTTEEQLQQVLDFMEYIESKHNKDTKK